MNCRHCAQPLHHQFLDLGFAPPSNAYLSKAALAKPEVYFPLRLLVCEHCWLVQTEDYAQAEQLFDDDYAYFSSISSSWLAHSQHYTIQIQQRLGLNAQSYVVEIASNDGYLLKNFVQAGIPCLGIEPTASTANAAEALGIPVLREFFTEALGQALATQGSQADLIIGNNVYAHVPDINDFTRGIKALLKPNGTVTLEFPHLMQLIQHNQFDTVYHEHFSYLSLFTVMRLFEAARLQVWDVEELPSHGGSLRIYGAHLEAAKNATPAVAELLAKETAHGMQQLPTYLDFQIRAERIKNALLSFLLEQKRLGKTVAAYGAAAKGNTLLNFAGIKTDLLAYVCDAAPSKQGKYLPGSHIPIVAPQVLMERQPELVLLLPWNIADELRLALSAIGDWGGRFVTAVPELRIY